MGISVRLRDIVSFKMILPVLCLYPLTAFLPLTLHMLFVKILSHLSGVLRCCVTLGEVCGMLDINPVPFCFQIVGFPHKVKYCRRFAVNSIFFDMLLYVLVRLFVFLDSVGIFLFETAL